MMQQVLLRMEECFRVLFNVFESQSLEGNHPYLEYRSFLKANGFRLRKFTDLYTDSIDFLTMLGTKADASAVQSLARSGLVDSRDFKSMKDRIYKDLEKYFKNEGGLLLDTMVKFELTPKQKTLDVSEHSIG